MTVFVNSDPAVFNRDVCAHLREHGYAVVRGLFDDDLVQSLIGQAARQFENPDVAGAVGYMQYQPDTRVIKTSMLEGACQFLASDQFIDLAQEYCGAELILSEVFSKTDFGRGYVYFDLHADYYAGYRYGEFSLADGAVSEPLGLSYLIYHHKTGEGAFSYSPGSHLLGAYKGLDPSSYPDDERKTILDRLQRLDGEAGDCIIFDPRGFHGQHQPNRVVRQSTIARYWRTDIFGRTQTKPLPVMVHELSGLSERQLRVLGLDGRPMKTREAEHHASFVRHGLSVRLVKAIVSATFLPTVVRRRIRMMRGASSG